MAQAMSGPPAGASHNRTGSADVGAAVAALAG